MTDQNWDAVLNEMIPKFKKAKDATEYQLAIIETAVKLDDSHIFTLCDILGWDINQNESKTY